MRVLLAVVAVVAALAAVVSLAVADVLAEDLVFDEGYYVVGARYLLYRLGLEKVFEEPYTVNVSSRNGTVDIYVEVRTPMPAIMLLGKPDPSNAEHPALGKLVYGLLLKASGWSVRPVRLVLLAVSSLAWGVLGYAVHSRWGLRGLAAFLLVLAVDRVSPGLRAYVVLDTLMLACLVLSVAFILLGRWRLGEAFLVLAPGFKEVGLVFVLAYGTLVFLAGRRSDALRVTVLGTLVLALSYGPYLVLLGPGYVWRAVRGLGEVFDPSACSALCIASLRVAWGSFVFYPPILLVWALGFAVAVRGGAGLAVEVVMAFFAVYMVFLFLASLFRAVYVYYYAPLTGLAGVPAGFLASRLDPILNRLGDVWGSRWRSLLRP